MSEDLLPAATDGLSDRFARVIAMATVVVTLLGALVGYSAARTAQAGDRDATTAAERAVAARGVADRDTGVAQLQYERYRLAREQRTHASNAEQEMLAAASPSRALDLERERRRWLTVAATTESMSQRLGHDLGSPPVPRRGPASPDTDLGFPSRFLAAASEGATRQIADADALNERSAERGSKLSIYAVVVAAMAVAVYLFSFALTPYGRAQRKLFVGTGGLLAVSGAVVATVIGLETVHTAPPAAAAAYARGEVAYQAADYDKAVAGLSEAIRLRPSFAGAYADRAAARAASQPENLNGAPSLAPRGALEADVADLRKAIGLKVNDPSIGTNLGFELYSMASIDRDDVLLDESIAMSRRTLARDRRAAEPAFNLGLALLVEGRWNEARAAYVEGIRRTLREPEGTRVTLVSAALTDLSNVPPRVDRGRVLALKSLVVGSVSRGTLGVRATKAKVSRLTIDAVPSTTLFHVLGDKRFDPSRSKIWAQWYARSASGWSAIDVVSGWLHWCGSGEASSCLALNQHDEPYEFDPYLSYSEPSRCLPPGGYRLELYAGGTLLASTERVIAMPRLVAAVDRVTKVALCQPPSWGPVAGKRPGLLSGWQSPDHLRSAYVAHVTVAAAGATSQERLQSGRRAALALIGQRLPGHDLRFVAPGGGAFMHLEWEEHTTYAFHGGLCDVGWGYARDDNSVIVGAVCGPPSWIGSKDQLAIANSFARI